MITAIAILLVFLIIYCSVKLFGGTTPGELWVGPEPIIEQRRETWNWMIEHFQQFPNSNLRYDYRHLHNVAMATKRYKELELLRRTGKISEEEYQLHFEQILPLINITDDLNPAYDATKE